MTPTRRAAALITCSSQRCAIVTYLWRVPTLLNATVTSNPKTAIPSTTRPKTIGGAPNEEPSAASAKTDNICTSQLNFKLRRVSAVTSLVFHVHAVFVNPSPNLEQVLTIYPSRVAPRTKLPYSRT